MPKFAAGGGFCNSNYESDSVNNIDECMLDCYVSDDCGTFEYNPDMELSCIRYVSQCAVIDDAAHSFYTKLSGLTLKHYSFFECKYNLILFQSLIGLKLSIIFNKFNW